MIDNRPSSRSERINFRKIDLPTLELSSPSSPELPDRNGWLSIGRNHILERHPTGREDICYQK
jgi:hypothetical protein